MKMLEGKKALILGVANEKSIAWGIANELRKNGAAIALTYQNEALGKRVLPLSEEISADFIFKFDAAEESDYLELREKIATVWGNFDILVHSLAFAHKDDLQKRFSEIEREGFAYACDISAFSFIHICGVLKDLMNPGASALAMSYLGSQRVLSSYSLMGVAKAALEAGTRYLADDLGPQGIRVNCISAGPIRTLAASGIQGTRQLIKDSMEKSPLRETVSQEDIGKSALYLCSDLSSKVTGQILYVDSGYSILGV